MGTEQGVPQAASKVKDFEQAVRRAERARVLAEVREEMERRAEKEEQDAASYTGLPSQAARNDAEIARATYCEVLDFLATLSPSEDTTEECGCPRAALGEHLSDCEQSDLHAALLRGEFERSFGDGIHSSKVQAEALLRGAANEQDRLRFTGLAEGLDCALKWVTEGSGAPLPDKGRS